MLSPGQLVLELSRTVGHPAGVGELLAPGMGNIPLLRLALGPATQKEEDRSSSGSRAQSGTLGSSESLQSCWSR